MVQSRPRAGDARWPAPQRHTRRPDHQRQRERDAEHNQHHVSVGGSRDGQDVVEAHHQIRDEDGAHRRHQRAVFLGFAVVLLLVAEQLHDELAALGIAPVVVVLPIDQTKPSKTPAGRHISVCPAAVRDDVTCASCGICAVSSRKAIIGFPAHGTGAKKAQAMFFAPRTMPTNYANLTQSNTF